MSQNNGPKLNKSINQAIKEADHLREQPVKFDYIKLEDLSKNIQILQDELCNNGKYSNTTGHKHNHTR